MLKTNKKRLTNAQIRHISDEFSANKIHLVSKGPVVTHLILERDNDIAVAVMDLDSPEESKIPVKYIDLGYMNLPSAIDRCPKGSKITEYCLIGAC